MEKEREKEKIFFILTILVVMIIAFALGNINLLFADELSTQEQSENNAVSETPTEQPTEVPATVTLEQPKENSEQPKEEKKEESEKQESQNIDYSDRLKDIFENTDDIKDGINDIKEIEENKILNDNDFKVTIQGIVGTMADTVGGTADTVSGIQSILQDISVSKNSTQVTISANDFDDVRLTINDENIINSISENSARNIYSISQHRQVLSVNAVLLTELIQAQTSYQYFT